MKAMDRRPKFRISPPQGWQFVVIKCAHHPKCTCLAMKYWVLAEVQKARLPYSPAVPATEGAQND